MTDAFIAIDWGTTNRRAYRIEAGAVAATVRDARGILAVAPGGYPAEIAAIRAELGDLPMLLAGMVGSNRGWIDAGYVDCPATLPRLAAQVRDVAPRVRMVPGVRTCTDYRPDVMRGEEVQLLGAMVAGLSPADALLCQPGTHCKWARMAGGALVDFTTAMTGEMFSLLKTHALIGAAMTGEVADNASFRDGVARSAEGDLLAALFGVRPASLLGVRADSAAASYVSGLLIGADCRAQVVPDAEVFLLADETLARLYTAAIAAIGARAMTVDSHAAFVAGITCLWETLS